MQVDCQSFSSTSLMQVVSATSTKSANTINTDVMKPVEVHLAGKIHNLPIACGISVCIDYMTNIVFSTVPTQDLKQ